jgi:ACR3 family arsenite efflux pump ArsB
MSQAPLMLGVIPTLVANNTYAMEKHLVDGKYIHKIVIGSGLGVAVGVPFTIGVLKRSVYLKRTTKDKFGFLFILHYYNYSGLLYVNR